MMLAAGSVQGLVYVLVIVLLAICGQISEAGVTVENGVKSMVYLSPKITLHPGSVSNKFYYDIDFPEGHIGIKSFNAELVDEAGNPVSIQETYLHHWVATRYYPRIGHKDPKNIGKFGYDQSDILSAGSSGVCDNGHPPFFGLGSDKRKTSTYVPDPYGIEVGNILDVFVGYEERWLLNIHAIDTRGVVNAMGCTECRCHLYNVTKDEYGRPLKPDYEGGLDCCYDGTQCRVKNGFESIERNLYLKYTVKWVDWSDSIVPVKIFIFDVTDTWQTTGYNVINCHIEYNIEQSTTGVGNNDFTSTRRSNATLPTSGDVVSGDVVYGVAHLHNGGIASALYGEDGRVICSSQSIYGKGYGAGDEAGYIVGMSTCYPKPGSVKISKGEVLSLVSNYSSEKSHYGVLGLFYILVAEPSLKLNDPIQMSEGEVLLSLESNYSSKRSHTGVMDLLYNLVAEPSLKLNDLIQIKQESVIPIFFWGIALFGLAISAAIVVSYRRNKQTEDGNLNNPLL